MKIIKIQDHFFMYHIPAIDEGKLGVNICVLLDGKKALLIDAGYKKDCKQVLDDLTSKGIAVVGVIPLHYHPDHIEGILLMDNPNIYGNRYAIETVKRFCDEDTPEKLSPTIIINDNYKLTFGAFELSFLHAPGHSDCSMIINVNDSYIHIGDLYMKTDHNQEVLPYLTWSDVKKHIESLDRILEFKDKTFLLSHGICPCQYDEIKQGINDRKIYFNALLESDNKISAEDAVKDCSKPFNFLRWRKYVE